MGTANLGLITWRSITRTLHSQLRTSSLERSTPRLAISILASSVRRCPEVDRRAFCCEVRGQARPLPLWIQPSFWCFFVSLFPALLLLLLLSSSLSFLSCLPH